MVTGGWKMSFIQTDGVKATTTTKPRTHRDREQIGGSQKWGGGAGGGQNG